MKRLVITAAVCCCLPAIAHNAICECFDNADGTITCEGGFSDGSSAAGIPVRVIDTTGRLLIDGAMSEYSDFTFDKPEVGFRVQFDAGEGHVIQIDGRDIEE
ncbi:MAG TPA: hypothetical protein VKQ06_02805 [Gammaproteobacteria bacterium]|nr:hypothetical protein [Gammaproteobacteria bacterium]